MSVRIATGLAPAFEIAQSTMRALEAHPQGRAVLEPMDSLALFATQQSGSDWLVAPQTARAADLLAGDSGRRTLQLLDAFTALGEGRANPLRMRSFAMAESPAQLNAHRVFSALHGAEPVSMIGGARMVNDAIVGVARQSPTVRGHWIGSNGVDSVALFPDAEGSALVNFLRTGDTEREPGRLAVDALAGRHEAVHALAGHAPVPRITAQDHWHEEGAAKLESEARANFDPFLRAAVGMDAPAGSAATPLTRFEQSVYTEEGATLARVLQHAGIDHARSDDAARMADVLQRGPFAERLDRITTAIAERHPSADPAAIRAALDQIGAAPRGQRSTAALDALLG